MVAGKKEHPAARNKTLYSRSPRKDPQTNMKHNYCIVKGKNWGTQMKFNAKKTVLEITQ